VPSLEDRKNLVLQLVLEEFIRTGKSVSSRVITEKIGRWKGSTIRYEMQKLKESGLLEDEHFSSGKIPTEEAFLWYVKRLIDEELFIIPDQYKRILSRVIDEVDTFQDAKKKIIRLLSEITCSSAVYFSEDDGLEIFSLKNIFLGQKNIDTEKILSLISLIDEMENIMRKNFSKLNKGRICILIGSQLPYGKSAGVSFSSIKISNPKDFVIGTINPIRSRYDILFGVLKEIEYMLNDFCN